MKPSEHKLVSTLVLACAVGLLAGCGHQASSITAPGVGKVAGAPVNTSEGPFGGQTVAWYEAQLNSHPNPQSAADPAWQEGLWCAGRDAQDNATVSADAVAKRQGTVSCQLLHRASRDPRRTKRASNGAAASGKEVGLYLVPRTRMSVGPAASRAPRTVAWGFAPLSTHFRLR
uniref:Lipoprotein n=1 Tax=mine drainage metagenome TaxID=410659 RepID=E6PKM9_9ZZZZ